MENNQHFSYNSMKTTFGFLPLIKRDELARECKEVRGIDSFLPYPPFDVVCFGDKELEINDRSFRFGSYYLQTEIVDDVAEEVQQKQKSLLCSSYFVRFSQFLRNVLSGGQDNTDYAPRCRLSSRRKVFTVSFSCPQVKFIREFGDVDPLPVAMQKLIASYFDNRGVVQINSLTFNFNQEADLYLPSDVKLRIRKLTISDLLVVFEEDILGQLASSIDEKSLPLEHVTLCATTANNDIFDHQLIQSAKRLEIICSDPANKKEELLDKLSNCRNLFTQLNLADLSLDEFVAIAQKWISDDRELGTTFCADVGRYEMVLDVQDALIESHGAVRGVLTDPEYADTFFKNCVTIPMAGEKELNVFGCKFEGSGAKDARIKCFPPKKYSNLYWSFKMEIMKAGSAVPRMNA